jgi:AcrR family transcriptional regulator
MKKKSRARSKEEKKKKFERIIDTARELYLNKGWQGFGMRALARKLHMSEGNLYNYVNSKRELWIAIRAQYFQEFNDGIESIIRKNRGKIPYIDLLIKIGEYYLNFATEDPPRYAMMTRISAPESEKIGPIERSYRPFNTMRIIQNLVEEAIDNGEIQAIKPDILTYFLYGQIYGAAHVERELKLIDPIREPIITGTRVLSIEDYRKFFFQELRKQMETSKWE